MAKMLSDMKVYEAGSPWPKEAPCYDLEDEEGEHFIGTEELRMALDADRRAALPDRNKK
jgi:hypothetical protein